MKEFEFSPRVAEKRSVRRASNFVGFILIALMIGQLVVELLMVALGDLIPDTVQTDPILGMLLNMVMYLFYVAVPVLIVALIARPGIHPFPIRRVSRGTYPLAIFGGMALSLLANIVTNIIVQFLVSQGVPEPQFPETYDPSLVNLLLNLLSTALLPAIFEEIALRGYVLGALRPHGEKLAIIVSALLFGLIHANIKQVPFAFALGLVLGWLTVQTNSILPAVALHFTNNAMVTVTDWVDQFIGTDGMMLMLFFTLFCLFGAVTTMVVFLQKKAHRDDLFRPVGNGVSFLSVGERTGALLTAPAMILGGGAWIALMAWTMF
ncbi:MAG: CPBP family intramembrane metalloprotease [Clostridia bacterium]|nr:CPBP family intramembrane metalloprotease [Clostridia bacterium]